MFDEHQHQDENNKEVSSTQNTTEEQQQQNGEKPQAPKVVEPLPTTDVKPASNHFKLHSFTGDNSKAKISNWIRMYESMAERSGWSDEEKKWNLSSYLEEEAFDFFIEYVLSKNPEWKQAKQTMMKRFDQFEIEPFMEFLSHKWTPQMELKEYFKKMRALGVAADLKEEDILAGLTRGLPVHLRQELNFVTSLQQWCAVSFCLQQRLNETSGSGYNKHQPWKNRGGRNNNGGRNRQNKQRNSHSEGVFTTKNLKFLVMFFVMFYDFRHP